MKQLWFGTLAVGLLASGALATPTINVGNTVVAPGLGGQKVALSVSGGDAVQGVNLNAEIADGGPAFGGTVNGPSIAALDILTGTIFAANNTGQQDFSGFPTQVYAGAVTTNAQLGISVNASGLLATFTFDSTGVATGTYPFRLVGLQYKNAQGQSISGDTDFAGTPSSITNGNLIVTYPGDFNLDGKVAFSDLVTLAGNYGKPGTYAQGDANHDGVVNFQDLVVLAANYGKTININPPAPATAFAATSPVPEPAALGAVALAATLLIRRHRD